MLRQLKENSLKVSDLEAVKLIERNARSLRGLETDGVQTDALQLRPELSLDYSVWKGQVMSLGFKIGRDRFYMVKDLRSMVEMFKTGEEFQYGKFLTAEHRPENLDSKSRRYLNFLRDYFEDLDALERAGYFSAIWSGGKKTLPLYGTQMDTWFDLMAGEDRLKVNGAQVIFETGRPIIGVTVTERQGLWRVTLLGDTLIVFSGLARSYLFWDDVFYRCEGHLEEDLADFLTTLIQKEGKLSVSQKDMPAFYQNVLLPLKGRIEIEGEAALAGWAPEPLVARVYLDAPDKNRVAGKVIFAYGAESHEGFQPKDVAKSQNLMAEYRLEHLIKHYLPGYDFAGNFRYLDAVGDEERLFDLFDTGLAQIEQQAEIYATDDFKSFGLRQSPRVQVGVKVHGDLLDLNLDLGDFDVRELSGVLEAYRENRRYYRLKDGSFAALRDNALGRLAEMIDSLALEEVMRPDQKAFQVPRFRALYLDALFKENRGLDYRRDETFKGMIRDMGNVSDADFKVPEGLQRVLRNYQKTGFRWLRTIEAWGFGGILADDMGLGKTLETIALLADAYGSGRVKQPSLIVCPASLVLNWESELRRFAPALSVAAVMGNAADRRQIIERTDAHIWLTSYDLLKRDIQYYEGKAFHYEIVDEAQYIKNHTTQNAKAIKVIRSQVRFALTGTPVENSLAELWSIFDFLMPGYLYTYNRFRDRFEIPIVREDSKRAVAALKRMVSPFILRRLKAEVLTELPEKVETTVYVSMEAEQEKLYRANLLRMRENLDQNKSENKIQILSMLTRLRQLCCEPGLVYENYKGESGKLTACLSLVEQSVDSGHRILVFSQFTTMLDILKKQLTRRKLSFYELTGSTPSKERLAMVNAFNAGGAQVFLISLKAGGTGLNLTGADVVVHYDPWWNKSAQNQATDRVYRIGQKNSVQVYSLICQGTIEEKIQMLQAKKSALADSIMTDGGAGLAQMSREEILALFD